MRFIEIKSLSVGHLIKLKDVWSVKSMQSCLVSYAGKALLGDEGATHLQNGET